MKTAQPCARTHARTHMQKYSSTNSRKGCMSMKSTNNLQSIFFFEYVSVITGVRENLNYLGGGVIHKGKK